MQNVIKVGTSLDYGLCEANNKDGNKCQNVINLSKGKYCDKHVKELYKKAESSRADLNSVYKPRNNLFKQSPKQLAKNGIYINKSPISKPLDITPSSINFLNISKNN